MTIVIPMAGLSERFIKAGYTLPKYMLYAGDKSLFNLSVSTFSNYFKSHKFLFIVRNVFESVNFIKSECKLLGIADYQIESLGWPTKGQAETVFMGINYNLVKDNEPITIFNIDTFQKDFIFPMNIKDYDGYLDTFTGSGDNWSYARTEKDSTRVVETSEKVQISNNCSTGLYYFKEAGVFRKAFVERSKQLENSTVELYIAPLYNLILDKNIHINRVMLNDITFCGTPTEYIDYLKKTFSV